MLKFSKSTVHMAPDLVNPFDFEQLQAAMDEASCITCGEHKGSNELFCSYECGAMPLNNFSN